MIIQFLSLRTNFNRDAQLLAEACKESGTVKFIVHTSVQSTAKYEEFKDFAVKYHMTAYWDGKTSAT